MQTAPGAVSPRRRKDSLASPSFLSILCWPPPRKGFSRGNGQNERTQTTFPSHPIPHSHVCAPPSALARSPPCSPLLSPLSLSILLGAYLSLSPPSPSELLALFLSLAVPSQDLLLLRRRRRCRHSIFFLLRVRWLNPVKYASVLKMSSH